MHEKASKYLIVETVMSGLSNAILNFAAAYAIFHGRGRVPTTGPLSLFLDLIGETFFVVSLSMLVPSLIARHRWRAGALPARENCESFAPGNLYVRAIVMGLLFAVVLAPLNYFLLPRLFPDGVSFGNVLLSKTVYGIIFGSLASWLAIRRLLVAVG